jgi:predicted dehydrogenase
MTALRTTFIGWGGCACRHAAILANLDQVQLVGSGNRGLAKAEPFTQQYAGGRARTYVEFEPMFAELDLDLVYICLPPHARGRAVELACQHGVHVLIEKPIALKRFFLGEPVQIFSMQDNRFHGDVEGYTSDDASGPTIRCELGGLAVLAATNGAILHGWKYDWRLMLPGLTADFADANHTVFHDTRPVGPDAAALAETVAGDTNMVLAETLDLLAAIRDRRPTAAPIGEGMRGLRLALAASQSAQRNTPVDPAVSPAGQDWISTSGTPRTSRIGSLVENLLAAQSAWLRAYSSLPQCYPISTGT